MSLLKYEKEFAFNYSALDANDNILPSAILEEMQNAAGEHADIMKIGYKDLLNQDLIWVLDRIKYTIIKSPYLNPCKLITWPIKASSIEINRDFLFVDSNNNPLIKATSRWCIINFKTRRLIRYNSINSVIEGEYIEDRVFDNPYTFFKKIDYSIINPVIDQNVHFSDLDHNKHMNNTKYAILAMNSIPNIENKRIVSLQLNFQKECIINDNLKTFVQELEPNHYIVSGLKNNEVSSFISEIELEDII